MRSTIKRGPRTRAVQRMHEARHVAGLKKFRDDIKRVGLTSVNFFEFKRDADNLVARKDGSVGVEPGGVQPASQAADAMLRSAGFSSVSLSTYSEALRRESDPAPVPASSSIRTRLAAVWTCMSAWLLGSTALAPRGKR